MPKHRAPSSQPETALPPPNVIGVLPAVPGGEENLLPKDAWLRPLRVEFGWWDDPAHLPGFADVVQLIWDNDEANPVAEKRYDESHYPDPPPDLWLEVPIARLDEGIHTLYYRLLPWNGSTPNPSVAVTITIDKTPPILAADSKLIFPPEVLPPNQLTARYLETEDRVRVFLPPYIMPKVGDVITWYWDRGPSGTTVGGTKTLTVSDYDQPLFIDIEGDWIRAQGDGDRYVWYTVTDRAGNPPNGQSAVERLIVNAQPVPRVLPPPKVVEASGTGWPANGTLNPVNATNGVKVILNPTSVIYPDEVPQVKWGNEGTLGYHLADPVTQGAWEYEIPKPFMAPHFGKAIPVNYLFRDNKGKLHESATYTLTVSQFPKDRLSAPQCAEGSPLSLASVPPEGVSITMIAWPFIAAGQRVMIWVEGQEDSTGQFIVQIVLDRHEVVATTGIVKGQALVPKAFLEKIRLNTSLVVKAYVSFDNGQTWDGSDSPNPNVQHFPWFRPRFIA